jgi:hypothetical protein
VDRRNRTGESCLQQPTHTVTIVHKFTSISRGQSGRKQSRPTLPEAKPSRREQTKPRRRAFYPANAFAGTGVNQPEKRPSDSGSLFKADEGDQLKLRIVRKIFSGVCEAPRCLGMER